MAGRRGEEGGHLYAKSPNRPPTAVCTYFKEFGTLKPLVGSCCLVTTTTQETKTMQSATEYVYIPTEKEQEAIYTDELEDGIAASAREQARIWADAINNGEVEGEVDEDFVHELLALNRNVIQNQQAANHVSRPPSPYFFGE